MPKTWTDERLAVFFTVPSIPCGATAQRIARDVYGSATNDNTERVRDTLDRAKAKGWVRQKEGWYLTSKGLSAQYAYGADYHVSGQNWDCWDELFTSVGAGRVRRRLQ